MEQKRKRMKRVSKMLVDAEPRYVSIVDHAANLTPFKDVKMDTPVEPVETPADTNDTVANVCKKELNFTNGSVVKEFAFGGDTFKEEAAVREYMEKNGWEGYTISKVEGGFIASGNYEGLTLSDEKVIPISDGVSVCVAKAEDPTEKTETTEEKKPAEVTVVEKKEEPAEYTQKYEAMLAYGNTLDEAIASGVAFDAMPIGFYEMFETFYNVLNVVFTNPDIVDKDAYLKKACADFADILVKLNSLTASLLSSTDLTKKEVGENWLNAIKNEKGLKMAEQKEEIVETAETPAAEAPEAPAEEAAAPAPAAEEPAAEVPAEEQPKAQEEAPVAPAEPEAAPAEEQPSEAPAEEPKEGDEVAELRKSVEDLRATIAELTSKVQKAEDSGADVEASPTKKSENFENSGCASEEETKKEKAVKSEMFRSQLAGFLGC